MHAEIRGRGRTWKVWTPDPGQLAHSVPMFDADGVLTEMLKVGAPPGDGGPRYVECYGGPFASIDEATEYARYLGYDEVKVNRTQTKEQALAKARAARGQ
jgi:hypothetical protein